MGFSRWTRKGPDENGITLSDVIRGLQFCVNSSAEIMEQHYLTSIDKYIDKETQTLLTRRFRIKDNYAVDVPLICLSDHHSLYMDELQVKLNVNLKDMGVKEATLPLTGDKSPFSVDRSCFSVELGSAVQDKDGSSTMEVCLKFKSTQPPEAFSRIIEKLDNAVAPFEIQPVPEEGQA